MRYIAFERKRITHGSSGCSSDAPQYFKRRDIEQNRKKKGGTETSAALILSKNNNEYGIF